MIDLMSTEKRAYLAKVAIIVVKAMCTFSPEYQAPPPRRPHATLQ